MKKLFTLFAFLSAFLGANAEEVKDYFVDFTQAGKSTIDWKADIVTDDLITADEDGIHITNPEARGNNWDFQFLLIGSDIGLDPDDPYTIKFVAKCDNGTANVNYKLGNWDGGIQGAITVTEEYQTYEVKGNATTASNFLMIQFGHYVGTVSFKSITVSHEENNSKPANWENTVVNGDAEGEFGEIACVWAKEFGVNLADEENAYSANPHPSEIGLEEGTSNHVFISHAKAVNPPMLWAEDGEQWGTPHSAGDPMPDNAWQNQMWLTFTHPLKAGEQVTVKFRYKASKAVKVDTQNHKLPGEYLGNSSIASSLNFTTEWQTYEKKFSAVAGMQSIAFNLGSEVYNEDIDFFLDDIELQQMVLEKGFFVAGVNNTDEFSYYDFENAIKFEEVGDGLYSATIGSEDPSTWVNELMISTVRGEDKSFQAQCIKIAKMAVNDPEAWVEYFEASKSKIKLPALGSWTISVMPDFGFINFVKVVGEEDREPVEIVANPTVVTINAVERNATEKEVEELLYEPNEGEEAGQPWDNQFCIMANRNLEEGEVVKIKFSCRADKEAIANTQCGGDAPGAYIHYAAIGDVEFTTEWVEHEYTYTVPSECGSNMASLTFNLAVMKEANTYEFKDIVWCNEGEDETLIDMEGKSSFFVKIGGGTAPYQYGTDPFDGITSVTSNTKASNATFNLAGQRVSKNFKGVVVKNGSKFLSK